MVYVMNAGPAGRVGIPGEKGIIGPVGDTGVTGAASIQIQDVRRRLSRDVHGAELPEVPDVYPGMLQYISTFFFPWRCRYDDKQSHQQYRNSRYNAYCNV